MLEEYDQLIYFCYLRNLKTGQLLKKMHIDDSYQASVCHKAYSEMVSNDWWDHFVFTLRVTVGLIKWERYVISSNEQAFPVASFFKIG